MQTERNVEMFTEDGKGSTETGGKADHVQLFQRPMLRRSSLEGADGQRRAAECSWTSTIGLSDHQHCMARKTSLQRSSNKTATMNSLWWRRNSSTWKESLKCPRKQRSRHGQDMFRIAMQECFDEAHFPDKWKIQKLAAAEARKTIAQWSRKGI